MIVYAGDYFSHKREMKKQKALMSQTMDLLSKNWYFVKCWSMMECEYCVDESIEKVESG